MNAVKIFLSDNAINEVTSYYVSLIEKSLKIAGKLVIRVNDINRISEGEAVVTILPFDALKLILLKKAKIIHWFQGIGPEEYQLLHSEDKTILRTKSIVKILEISEQIVLRKSLGRIFVSESMARHYKEKYHMPDIDYVVIPCYNTKLYNKDYDNNRYENPTFIYVGSSYAWQRLDKTLDIFKAVENLIPFARLSVMTKDKEAVKYMAEQRKIKNISIGYASQDELDIIMSNHKYAFLVRDDIDINRVSTPTKMANYISVGLIPIYSDAIDAFRENINLADFGICLPNNLSIHEIAVRIANHHNRTKDYINLEEMRGIKEQIFKNYYSDDVNISKLVDYFKNTKFGGWL